MTAITPFNNNLDLKESLSAYPRSFFPDMSQVASLILSGGEGTRLYPLTLTRCKPAISFGGKYRLIDVPISNSFHANCGKIFILTQFLSSSLHTHICQTYMQGGGRSNFIEILTAEQKPNNKDWYQGTADAVRQNIHYLREYPFEYFLILSGDQLYNIDFCQMMRCAKESDADVTVAALPISAQDAPRLGILKVNEQSFITDFYEKPQEKSLLQKMRCKAQVLEKMGMSATNKRYLGSMGIYLFKRKALFDLLQQDSREDFGKHLIPRMVQAGKAAAFLYEGYWEDIGTIQSFYEANMAMATEHSPFDFHNENRPIFSNRQHLPPTKFSHTQLKQSILCEGCRVEADEIANSLLGPRTIIQKGCIIRNSYLMGNNYYSSSVKDHPKMPSHPHIGENTIIKRAIIDKNTCIGKGVQLINKQKLTHYNGDLVYIRDGIIIVPRGVTIPDGFIL